MRAHTITSKDLKAASASLKAVRRLFPEHFVMEEGDLRWSVSSPNEVTKELDQLAENVAIIEAFKSQSPEERDFDSIPVLQAHRIIENAIDAGQSSLLKRFAEAIDEYNSGFKDRSKEDQAVIHLLIASRILYMEQRGKPPFVKEELKAKAKLLWVRTKLRSEGRNLDEVDLKNEIALLPEMNWDRVYKKLGLKGFKNGKPGPKPKPKL